MTVLHDLIQAYEHMARKGLVPAYGYDSLNVPYGLLVDEDGILTDIIQLYEGKTARHMMSVPHHGPRSTNILPFFMADACGYMLGDNGKDKEGARRRWEAGAALHERLLEHADSPAARTVLNYYRHGMQAETAHRLADMMGEGVWKRILASNLTLLHEENGSIRPMVDDPTIRAAWDTEFERLNGQGDGPVLDDILTGRPVRVALTHPKVKGVAGAQSSGASLVSYNKPAYESYGLTQCANGAIGERDAYRYTTALNALLADPAHVMRLGGDTLVVWSDGGRPEYTSLFRAACMGASADDKAGEAGLLAACSALAQGRPYGTGDVGLDPGEHYHLLMLKPNGARLAIRDYLTDTFGRLAGNVMRHHADLRIPRPPFDHTETMGLRRIMRQTVNTNIQGAEPRPDLTAAVYEAVIMGTAYPQALYTAVRGRILKDRSVNADRAAILKAFLLRQSHDETLKEAVRMTGQADTDYKPYVLGQMFAIYEQIQQNANPTVQRTIRSLHFTSACAHPARTFALLGEGAMKHLGQRWEYPGMKIILQKRLQELAVKIGDRYPETLTLEEQGAFQLGYYAENLRRYGKHGKTADDADGEQ